MLPFEEAFRLVLTRAKLMCRACAEQNPSGMVAVLKLADEAVEALCAEHHAYPVNYNCPGQVVCAMLAQEIPAFTDAVKAAGGRALALPVNGGFHSPLMQAAAAGLAEFASTLAFCEPNMPLYADATCKPYTAAQASWLLGAQVESPVRFRADHTNAAGRVCGFH